MILFHSIPHTHHTTLLPQVLTRYASLQSTAVTLQSTIAVTLQSTSAVKLQSTSAVTLQSTERVLTLKQSPHTQLSQKTKQTIESKKETSEFFLIFF